MKKNKLVNRLLVAFSLTVIAVGCGDDDGDKVSAGFSGIASSYIEGEGDVTTTISFVNGSVSLSDIVFEGSATQGEDYEVIGVTDEGVEIKFIDDSDCEDTETLRLRIVNTSGIGNKVHTVTLFSSNLNVDIDLADWVGTYGGEDIILTSSGSTVWSGVADATLAVTEGTYTIDGLGVDFIESIWAETVTESAPVVLTATSEGVITIEEQYLYTTDYDGDPYDYNIVGTGQVNKCDGTITLYYDIKYADDGFSLANYYNSYNSVSGFFTSLLELEEE